MMGVIERAVPERPEQIHIVGPTGKDQYLRYHGDCEPGVGLHDYRGPGNGHARRTGDRGGEHALPRTRIYARAFNMGRILWLARKDLDDLPGYRLSAEQVETAWNYAYRFFFEFPLEFPWRLMHFWNDVEIWPLKRVLSEEGETRFGRTFAYLAGEPMIW